MSGQLTAERSGLEKKDKGELQAIVAALGGKSSARSRKGELIDQIIELSEAELPDEDSASVDDSGRDSSDSADSDSDESDPGDSDDSDSDDSDSDDSDSDEAAGSAGGDDKDSESFKGGRKSRQTQNRRTDDEEEPNKRRRRGRGRGRGRDRDRDNGSNEPILAEPFAVEGFLELRDEGYGFLRVNGLLPSRDDVYVSVKQVRQYGLRKGDHLAGMSRPANRNEKNPGFHQIDSVNGQAPEDARDRPEFDELTAVFPDHEIQLHPGDGAAELTPNLVDLFVPLGRGQRVLLSAPPQAGTTTFVKDLALAIEQNNPNMELLVLLIDQRPEEVAWIRSELATGEVIASPYDRPAEEHCAVAEITVERAKRLAESGRDVCLVVDSFSKLVLAYQASSSAGGRGNSANLDSLAIFPAKRLFGSARKFEEGGSFTIIATAQVETGLPNAAAIAQELAGAANSHIVLSEELAQHGVFPALDVTASATRREDVLLGEDQAVEFGRLRRAIIEKIVADESLSLGTSKLHQQISSADSIDDFLAEIMKSLSQK